MDKPENKDDDEDDDNEDVDVLEENGLPKTLAKASQAGFDEIPPKSPPLSQDVSTLDFDHKHTAMTDQVGRMEIAGEPIDSGPATSLDDMAQPSGRPRSTSKSSVESEEDVIVFGGRRCENKKPVRQPDSTPSITATAATEKEASAIGKGNVSPLLDNNPAVSSSNYFGQPPAASGGSEELPFSKIFLDPKPNFGRRRGRRRGRAEHDIEDEEEALIQDYIAHMKDDETDDDEEQGQEQVSAKTEHFRFSHAAGEENVKVQMRSSEKQKVPDVLDEDLDWSSGDLEDFDNMSTTDDEITEIGRVYADRLRPSGIQYLVTALGKGPSDACWVLGKKLTSTTARTQIQLFEERREVELDLHNETFSTSSTDSDEGADELQGDLKDTMRSEDDENERLSKLTARMTDAQIAQALEMQDKLGMPTNEVLLFNGQEDNEFTNGDNFIPFSSKRHVSNRTRSKRNLHKKVNFPSAEAFADALDQDPYNGFDVMDFDRPSLKPKRKGRKSAGLPFELEDEELVSQLQQSWENDRSKKAAKKREREEMRQAGLLGSKAMNSRVDIHTKYQESGMDAEQIRTEIRSFLMQEIEALALAPMAADMRASVHRLARALNLKSHSQGKGEGRFPILTKTAQTRQYTINNVWEIDALLNHRKFFPRNAGSSNTPKQTRGGRRSGGGVLAGATYMDGDVVGASAPEIGAENRGRAMLEKMGWSSGMGIGKVGNKGSIDVIKHVVKNTKAGLG